MSHHANQHAGVLAGLHHHRLLDDAARRGLAAHVPRAPEQVTASRVRHRRARRVIGATAAIAVVAGGGLTAYALVGDRSGPPVAPRDVLVVDRWVRAV